MSEQIRQTVNQAHSGPQWNSSVHPRWCCSNQRVTSLTVCTHKCQAKLVGFFSPIGFVSGSENSESCWGFCATFQISLKAEGVTSADHWPQSALWQPLGYLMSSDWQGKGFNLDNATGAIPFFVLILVLLIQVMISDQKRWWSVTPYNCFV